MKILLIGGAGFVGGHLKNALMARNHEVFIADRMENAAQIDFYRKIDLDNRDLIRDILTGIRPDCIVHLAAQSSVSLSWKEPEQTLRTNVSGSLNLFQVAAEVNPCRFIFIGSGEEYGILCTEDQAFTEESPCVPCNPYAVSKLCTGQLLALLAKKKQIPFVHLRPFNHFGPQQRTGFVIADFCSQIARAEQTGKSATIKVGNLEMKRDFLYIDDIVSAYCLFAEAERYPHGIYNLSSGKAYRIREILDYLVSQSRVSIQVEIDPEKYRPVEAPILQSSAELAWLDFSWKPQYSLQEGLQKTLDWWRIRTEG